MKTACCLLLVGAVLDFVGGCASTAQQRTQQTENLLLASGFHVVPASTPAQQAHLQTLPPGKVTAVTRNGKKWYVYPDAVRQQLYVGTPFEYQNFQGYAQDATLLHEQLETGNLAQDSIGWSSWSYWDFRD